MAACSFPDWGEAKTSLYIGLMNFAMGIGYSLYPVQPYEQSREEFRKLTIQIEGVTELQLEVEFIPLDQEDAEVKEMETVEPIKGWLIKGGIHDERRNIQRPI